MLIEKYRKTIEACRFCPMCKVACTVGNITKNEANYPRGKALILFTILKKMREFNEDIIERIYQCAICGLCKDWCISDYDIPELIMAARADIVDSGKIPPRVLGIYEDIKKTGNPHATIYDNEEISAVLDKKIRKIGKRAKILYFIGNTVFSRPEIGEATIGILSYTGTDFTILSKENRGVELLYQLGFRKEAEGLAKENVEVINKTRCEVIITSDADEYLAFKRDYPRLGANLNSDIKIMHTTEYINLLLQENKLSFSREINKSVTYHDPSSLGRYLGFYEAPREVIKAIPGIKFKEMRWNKDKARCCGAGGGLLFTNPEIAAEAAENVIDEAIEIGTEIIVTASPLCKQSLVKHEEKLQKNSVEVYDITELANEAI